MIPKQNDLIRALSIGSFSIGLVPSVSNDGLYNLKKSEGLDVKAVLEVMRKIYA